MSAETKAALKRLRDSTALDWGRVLAQDRDDTIAALREIERLTAALAELDAAVTEMLRQPGAVGLEIQPAIVGAVARHNRKTGETP